MVESEHPERVLTALAVADLDASVDVPLGTPVPSGNCIRVSGAGDILQRVLQEVSQEYPPRTVVYDVAGDSPSVDESEIVPCDAINTSDSEIGMPCLRIVNTEGLALGDEQEPAYSYLTDNGEGLQSFGNVQAYNLAPRAYTRESLASNIMLPEMLVEQGHYVNCAETQPSENLIHQDILSCNMTSESINDFSSAPKRFTLSSTMSTTTTVQSSTAKIAPLGSSQNPIRIIQQGNQYKSLQNLTSDQLTQIMQVVQQQQLLRSSQQTGQASVLYNPQTQTKIVFRVVYPSELHKSASSSVPLSPDCTNSLSLVDSSHNGTAAQSQKKSYHKRKHVDEERASAPEMSRQEKELRKKHKQRTRYGRVSRPPQYMVKDYKHIHPVDYDEDYDDSDGGYSDFKEGSSGDEATTTEKLKNTDRFVQGQSGQLGNGKPRKHKCETCDKGYIGLGGLARHYRLNPNHGHLTNETGVNGLDAYNSSDSFQSTSLSSSVPITSTSMIQPMSTTFADSIISTSASLLDSGQHQTSGGDTVDMEISGAITNSSTAVASSLSIFENVRSAISPNDANVASAITLTENPPRRGKRGRPPSHQQAERRKERLQELVRQCTEEELMEVVMPRLSASVNLWEFLLMKTECKTARPNLIEMIKEFEDLHKQIGVMFREKLIPISARSSFSFGCEEEKADNESCPETFENLAEEAHVKPKAIPNKTVIEVLTPDIARCLGLNIGRYEVRDDEPLRQYKLLTSNPATVHSNPSLATIRTVELVPQDQLIALPLRKRLRLTETAITRTTSAATVNEAAPFYNSNKTTSGDGQEFESCGLSVAVSSTFAKPERCQALNSELESTKQKLKSSSQISGNEPSLPDIETNADTVLKNRIIDLGCSSSHSTESVVVLSSQIHLNTHENSSSGLPRMIGTTQHLPKTEASNFSIGYKHSTATTKCRNFVQMSNSVQRERLKPATKLHEFTNRTCVSSDSNAAMQNVKHFSDSSMHKFGHISDLASLKKVVSVPVSTNCLSMRSLPSNGQSFVLLKSECDNQSFSVSMHNLDHTSQPKFTDLFANSCSSSRCMEAQDNTQAASVVKPELESLCRDTDSVDNHAHNVNGCIPLISENLLDAARCTEYDVAKTRVEFVPISIQNSGNVDGKMNESQELLIGDDCEIAEFDSSSSNQEIQVDENAQLIQTNDGLIIIRNPDGTIQIHGHPGQQISFETIQALIGLDQYSNHQSLFENTQES